MKILCNILRYPSQLELGLDMLKPRPWIVLPKVRQLDGGSVDRAEISRTASGGGRRGRIIFTTAVV